MTQQEKEQMPIEERRLVAEIRQLLRTKRTASELQTSIIELVKSPLVKEYWQSQQKQETPELDLIKTEFYRLAGAGDFQNDIDLVCVEKIWAHFAQYIKGTDEYYTMDVIPDRIPGERFSDWCLVWSTSKIPFTDFYDHIHKKWVCQNTNVIESYVKWQPLPKAPKEVGNV